MGSTRVNVPTKDDGQHRPGINYTVNQTQQDAARFVFQPSTAPTFHHDQISSNVQTDNAKLLGTEMAVYSVNRYVSTHQIRDCKSSYPEVATRLSPSQTTPSAPLVVTSHAVRVTRVADSFAESLRKYSSLTPDSSRSSDLIERILSATLSKRANKTKKMHILKHSKKNKSLIDHPINKNPPTYPRIKRAFAITKGNVNVDSKTKPASPMKSYLTSTPTAAPRDTSPRVQRMGRGAEVRYINDVRKCIREAIRHVWNEDDVVCPEIQRRYAIHQKEYHSPNKNIGCGTFCINPENQIPTTSRELEATNNRKGICCLCNNKLPCDCQMKISTKTKEDSQTTTERVFGRCLKFCDQYTSQNALNTMSCCQFCREEQDVYGDTLKQVNEWLEEIPVNVNYSCDDNAKRQVIVKKLVLSLVKCKGIEDKQKVEIRRCLDVLPMWQPTDLYDRDAFRNNLIESLLNRLKLPYENSNLNGVTNIREADTNVPRISETSGNNTDVNKSKLLDEKIKDDIKRIIDITKNNHLDSRTESLLMEALIIKLKVLSTSAHPKSDVTQNVDNVDKQNVQEILAQKVSQVLNELPLGVDQIMKKVMKEEIIDVILKKINKDQKTDNENLIEKLTNETFADLSTNATTSITETPEQLREQIQKYVTEHIADLFREHALDLKNCSKIQNDLTNIITDQIMRGNNENKFKEKAFSLLQEINLSKSKTEDLCNTILRDTNDMSLGFKNKTLPIFSNKMSKPTLKRNTVKTTEKEIINFITEVTSSFDSKYKQQIISSTKYLAERIENIVSNNKRPNKEKEELIYKAIYNFMKSKGLPINGRCKKFASNITKRLLNTPPKSSTLQKTGDDGYFCSPTLSSIECEDNLNKLGQASLVQIYENISLNAISQEVLRCIEKIPSERVISHDKNYHKIIAKEIAKRIRSTTNQSSSPDLVLGQTVMQWLPKLIKEPNKTELSQVTNDLKKIMHQNILPSRNGTDELIITLKTGMMDWLKNTSMYRRRNTEEKLFQENIVTNLASDLNQIINNLKSEQNGFDEDLILKTIENRIKQFPMDPKSKFDNKYHHNIAVELLNHLKTIEAIPDITSSSVNSITEEVLKWTKKIPPHRLISHDPNHHRMVAKEFSKRIKENVQKSSNLDIVLRNEVQQWLPEIMKEPNESEMRKITDEFVKIIKPKVLSNVLPGQVRKQFSNTLKDSVKEWLQNTEMYQRRNTEEKLVIDNLMSDLAVDLCHTIDNLTPNQKDAQRILLKAIETRIKQLPLDPNVKYNEGYHQKLALELLNHLKELQVLNVSSEGNGELETAISSWIQNLPLRREINSQELADLGTNIQSILSEYLNGATTDAEEHLKQRIITQLKYLPFKDDFGNEDKLPKLVDSLLAKVKYGIIVDDNTRQSLQREVAFRCERLSIDTGNKPEDIKKIQQLKENLMKGLVTIINKLNLNPEVLKNDALYEKLVKDEIEQLLNTLPINEYGRRLSGPLKNDLVNITKEVSMLERRDSAEKNYKKRLLDTIDKTLPSTLNMSLDRRTSFENMKENLADAFVSVFKNTNGNRTEYKENIKQEINKFCNDYLKMYPATPIDADTLCQNLYVALQNVPLPPVPENISFDPAASIKAEVEHCLAELPLRDTETNDLLRERFVDFLLSSARDPQTQLESFESLQKRITEKLNEFSFDTENIPNKTLVSKNLASLIKNSYRTSRGLNTLTPTDRRRTESLPRTSQDLSPHQTDTRRSLHDREPFYECVPYCSNVGNQTELTPECSISLRNRINYEALSFAKHRFCRVPGNFVNRSNRKALPKRKKTQGAQTSNICEMPPYIIVKQYYWDGHVPCQVNGSLQELRAAQYEPRRTVPSLPLAQPTVPCTPPEPSSGYCRSARRLCVHSPCRSHISMIDPHFTTLSVPMEHQGMEEELWATGKQCPDMNYRNRQSNINVPRNDAGTESFIARTTSESRTQRRRFCSEPCATCSNARIQDINRCSKCFPQDYVEYGSEISHINDQTGGPDAGIAQVDVDRNAECRCCGHINENLARPAPGNNMTSRQCSGSSNKRVNCCGALCLRPSYIYFS